MDYHQSEVTVRRYLRSVCIYVSIFFERQNVVVLCLLIKSVFDVSRQIVVYNVETMIWQFVKRYVIYVQSTERQ